MCPTCSRALALASNLCQLGHAQLLTGQQLPRWRSQRMPFWSFMTGFAFLKKKEE